MVLFLDLDRKRCSKYDRIMSPRNGVFIFKRSKAGPSTTVRALSASLSKNESICRLTALIGSLLV
jgi:hypothetical protein